MTENKSLKKKLVQTSSTNNNNNNSNRSDDRRKPVSALWKKKAIYQRFIKQHMTPSVYLPFAFFLLQMGRISLYFHFFGA